MNEEYSPFKIGERLYHSGLGISDIWGAVCCDEDMEEAYLGYTEAQAKDLAQQRITKIMNQLGMKNI